jgi:hypothetical protein
MMMVRCSLYQVTRDIRAAHRNYDKALKAIDVAPRHKPSIAIERLMAGFKIRRPSIHKK